MSPEQVEGWVRAAKAKREAVHELDAYRLFHGAADGLSRLAIERFGDSVRISGGTEKAELLEAVVAGLDQPERVFYRFSGAVEGGPPGDDGVRIITENALRFEVALLGARNPGLFLDGRLARSWVREHAAGQRVLNLFAYTCGFGVAAAAGGARATTNVDTSRGVLKRGERNYALNDLPTDGRTFWKSDAREALRRLRKRKARFDLVILDPPPVRQRQRGRSVDPVQNLESLARACAAIIEPGGTLLLLNATRSLSPEVLVEKVGMGAPYWQGSSGPDFPPLDGQKALRVMAFKRT